ncbi:50S ribosomal protein L4 [Patescibacteria group bacterium]|nr:MAG: 50S ribosomal protein L4 [Patescibacteria group bacterium]
MPEASVHNQIGEKIGQQKLAAAVFGAKVVPHLIHEAVVSMRSNARRSTAHTKTRGEISGGGKKPWRQKGTGRARHGSTRSPIWRGGGITFGPRNDRNYSKKMNAQARKTALLGALSDKAGSGNIIVLDDFKNDKPKTKEMFKMLIALKIKFPALLVIPKTDKAIKKIGQNIKDVMINTADNLHLLDILKAKNIVIIKKAVEEIESKYGVK